MYSIGVDGGGTRTRAVMVDGEGAISAVSTGGCGNFQVVGLGGLKSLLDRLLGELGAVSQDRSLCLALAGAGRRPERMAIAAMARSRGWAQRVEVVSDAEGALTGAHGGGPGLIAISGTGSIVLGKDESGREARAGGWGPLLGDEGSGYSIGLEALRAVLRAEDGWGDKTLLAGELKKALGLENWDQLVQKVYRSEIDRQHISALCPLVFAAARRGDGAARKIIEEAGSALGSQVSAVARRLCLRGAVALSCTGGVFKEREMLWPSMQRAVRGEVETLRFTKPLLPPVLGAVLIARRQAGLDCGREFIDLLARS